MSLPNNVIPLSSFVGPRTGAPTQYTPYSVSSAHVDYKVANLLNNLDFTEQPETSLEEIAQQIYTKLEDLHESSTQWSSADDSVFVERMCKVGFKNKLFAVSQDMSSSAKFLKEGRPGLQLTDLPPEFLNGAAQLSGNMLISLRRLASLEGCWSLKSEILDHVAEIERHVRAIQARRKEILERSKVEYYMRKPATALTRRPAAGVDEIVGGLGEMSTDQMADEWWIKDLLAEHEAAEGKTPPCDGGVDVCMNRHHDDEMMDS